MYQYTKIHTEVKYLKLAVAFKFKSRFNHLPFYSIIPVSLFFLYEKRSPNLTSFAYFSAWPYPITTSNQPCWMITNIQGHWMTKKHPPHLSKMGVLCSTNCFFGNMVSLGDQEKTEIKFKSWKNYFISFCSVMEKCWA